MELFSESYQKINQAFSLSALMKYPPASSKGGPAILIAVKCLAAECLLSFASWFPVDAVVSVRAALLFFLSLFLLRCTVKLQFIYVNQPLTKLKFAECYLHLNFHVVHLCFSKIKSWKIDNTSHKVIVDFESDSERGTPAVRKASTTRSSKQTYVGP